MYDFVNRPNRLLQHTAKWKETESDPDVLPLWIADMDFAPVPEIKEALKDYVSQYVFGYPETPDSLYEAIQDWEEAEHGYRPPKESLLLISGVVPAISVAIQAYTEPGDAVLIHTPAYPPFARTVRLNHRRLVSFSLTEQAGQFQIDWDQLEETIQAEKVKLYVLCNPQNPGGRVWSREELEKIATICQQHGVLLVSDEIHQDFVWQDRHIPFLSLNETVKDFSLVLSSATKTFNIADTKNSYVIIENPQLRQRFAEVRLANNQHEVPTIGLIATEVAYRKGKPWLQELRQVLQNQIAYVVERLEAETDIHVMQPQGTYLVWLDFSAYPDSHEELARRLRQEAKVLLNDGRTFGEEGDKHFRLNVATPRETLAEAVNRMVATFGH